LFVTTLALDGDALLQPGAQNAFVQNCLLLHGQYGYCTDLALEQRLRDVLGLWIGDGTAQIMKLIIARRKLGRTLAPQTGDLRFVIYNPASISRRSSTVSSA
jgi:hypothetical protein